MTHFFILNLHHYTDITSTIILKYLLPHRRPPEFGGTGKDPVWAISTDNLGPDLVYVPDSSTHGTIKPNRPMS